MPGMKKCSFCGKPENRIQNLFMAGDVNICDECVMHCYEMLMNNDALGYDPNGKRHTMPRKTVGSIKLITPVEIKSVLDQYVIGQESAKIALSVAVYNHYKRIMCEDTKQDKEQCYPAGSYRCRQDAACADSCKDTSGPVRHCRCDYTYRSGLCR